MESYPHYEKGRPTGEYQPHGTPNHSKPSKSDLLSSAKVIAGAVKGGEQKDFNKAEIAGAAANILHAASEYGKFEDKPIGKAIGKAENYLHKFSSHSSTTTTTTTNSGTAGGHYTTTTTTSSETTHSANRPGKDQGHGQSGGSGGGYGEYIKIAEGLLHKNSGGGHGSSGAPSHSSENSGGSAGKYGDYIKMAEGAFSKFSGDHSNTSGNAHSGGQPGHSGGQQGHSGSGGYGEYAKMAGEFLKKH